MLLKILKRLHSWIKEFYDAISFALLLNRLIKNNEKRIIELESLHLKFLNE